MITVIHQTHEILSFFFRLEWRDFSHNRNLGLRRARGRADYHLILDADFTLEIADAFNARDLGADAYWLRFNGDTDWAVVRMISDKHEWTYQGVAHECLGSPTARDIRHLSSLSLTHHEDGGNREGRFEKYLKLLLDAFEKEPENSRYAFYTAQTYKDMNSPAQAIEWYQKRLVLGGWDEESWYSTYQLARCRQAAGHSWAEVLDAYLQSYQLRPWRLEPLLPLCQSYRALGQFALAHLFSAPALQAQYPSEDMLFIERSVYDYGLLMEHAIACYWIGDHEKAVRLNTQVLEVERLPDNYRISALRNRDLSLQILRGYKKAA